MKNNRITLLSVSGLFAALIFVFTAYLHIPSHAGYLHIGDGFIFLAACLLPLPYAAAAGACGAMLADCLTGFAIWAPASVIIKTATVLFFSRKTEKIINARNLFAILPSALICAGGYYFYEVILTGNFFASALDIPGNIVQSVISGVLFICLGLTLDKTNAKKYI